MKLLCAEFKKKTWTWYIVIIKSKVMTHLLAYLPCYNSWKATHVETRVRHSSISILADLLFITNKHICNKPTRWKNLTKGVKDLVLSKTNCFILKYLIIKNSDLLFLSKLNSEACNKVIHHQCRIYWKINKNYS